MRPTLLALLFLIPEAHPQWTLQDAHTAADLRGIDSLGGGVAWASGSNGTVLRTEDAGFVWQLCAIPPGAEHLDFRAIQAFDNNTAIVMSSGKGDLSRLYKTTDGCQTWKLLFTNPDKDGFWDALTATPESAFLVGDPVDGRFVIYESRQKGFEDWNRFGEKTNIFHFPYTPAPGEGLFAASNSVLQGDPSTNIAFVTGGKSGSRFYLGLWNEKVALNHVSAGYFEANLPLVKAEAAGAFSIASSRQIAEGRHYVVVGGDYTKPADVAGTAAYSLDGGKNFKPAKTPPHGYRSAVAYDIKSKTWITVGPNGTDISTDDGRNWHPLKPNPTAGDTPDADQHWNALSLPYVVGPHGRIATLRPDALPTQTK